MAEYSNQQINALYEEYSRLDESHLLNIIRSELRNSIQVIHSKLKEKDHTISLIRNDISEIFGNIRDTVEIKVKEIQENPNGDFSNYNISCSCQDLELLTTQFQKHLIEREGINNQLITLQYLEVNCDSVENFRQSCFSLFNEMPDKVFDIINQYEYPLRYISKIINRLAPILAAASLGTAAACIVAILTMTIEDYIITLYEEKKLIKQKRALCSRNMSRPKYNLIEMDIKIGSELVWKENQSIKVITVSHNSVMYKGTVWLLSKLTAKLSQKKCTYLNPKTKWLYNNKLLQEIYDAIYPHYF